MSITWSRRRVLTEGFLPVAAALSLPSAFGAERTAPTGSNITDGSGAVTADSALGGRLTTPVRINGHGPFHFLVDTGSERTLIASELAERLTLPHGRKVMVEGIVRGEPANLVEIHDLKMGSLVCSRLQVPTLPRSELSADGYLGLDVLDDRRVIFDFIAGTLTVTKPRGVFSEFWTRFNTDEVRVPTLGNSGRLRAKDCLIDGVRAAAFVDTGAQISIINQALYAALQQRDDGRALPTTQTLTGVTGGSIDGTTTMLNMVRLGSMVMTFTTAVAADLPVFKLWGLNEQPALLIGMDCLRRCARVSIDYGRKELHFDMASAHLPQPLEAALPRLMG
ncbi:MAG TPA: retroviral-like aspartic protease family protein [Steroidobacteraceae bacterium]|nr:retroviral-like aspartic protease family protein [Steroidobacteraceae bacterium]